MTYEIHATDFQPPEALQQMVKDHFALLKVGPCLTFALRKAFYGLAQIEAQLPGIPAKSNLIAVMEHLMLTRPAHWQSHYQGTKEAIRHWLHFSLRDRMRYYWAFPEARHAVDRLLHNLGRPIPDDLLHLHLADLYPDMQAHGLANDPRAIVQLAVGKALAPYLEACGQYAS
jgi:D-tagatose-1,6-bisphosphate aldolase subunit GatZ/KbaZ